MSGELENQGTPNEISYDVNKDSQEVQFLGLLDRLGSTEKALTGMFDWTCATCDKQNRDATLVKPQQPFLANWVCPHCMTLTLVRFRARPAADWVAHHTLAMTDHALEHLSPDDVGGNNSSIEPNTTSRHGKRVVAWSISLLVLLVLVLALIGVRVPGGSSADIQAADTIQGPSLPSSRLPGRWVSDDNTHSLHFGPVDLVARIGVYVRLDHQTLKRSRRSYWIVYEDIESDQLTIEDWPAQEEDEDGPPPEDVMRSRATFHVPRDGHRMIRIDVDHDRPILGTYRKQ
jgi:hypothetical protein